jgi:DNA polymerase IV
MDAFYASVEQRDNPNLKGKPLAVGGSASRGVVAAASYEARKFGVRSAMSSKIAAQKCPNLIFVKPRFEAYKTVSKQIRDIFAEYTSLIEPLSLDEAYLDVTENNLGITTATQIATEIKLKIFERTHLTASAGISYNKFLAKIASDMNKPNGMYLIKPKVAEAFVDQLPIEKFHGIGKVTAEKLHKMNIFTGSDLKAKEEGFLKQHFGKAGSYYYQIARAIDDRPVNPDLTRKSIGAENTFDTDLHTLTEMQIQFTSIINEVWKRVERSKLYGRTVSIKIKFDNFESITRSKSSIHAIHDFILFEKMVFELLESAFPFSNGIRLLGATISNLESEMEMVGKQLTIEF